MELPVYVAWSLKHQNSAQHITLPTEMFFLCLCFYLFVVSQWVFHVFFGLLVRLLKYWLFL